MGTDSGLNKVYPNSQSEVYIYERKVTLDAVEESGWLLTPAEASKIMVTFSGGGAIGLIQTNTDSVAENKTGTPVPLDWTAGPVTVTTGETFEPVSAIRLKQNNAGATQVTIKYSVGVIQR